MVDNKEVANEPPPSNQSVAKDVIVSKPLELTKGPVENDLPERVDGNEEAQADSGGFLYALQFIGTTLLYILIGGKGWRAKKQGLALGSWTIGTVIGGVLYFCLARNLNPFVSFLVIPGGLLVLALILQQIHKSIPN